jgi:hypothetical protein
VLFVVLAMLVSVVAAGLVMTYVAYPARGRAVPHVPWIGEAMTRAARPLDLTVEEEGSDESRRRAGSRG